MSTSSDSSFRLTSIYTRTGDEGTTGLADGTRLDKTHVRFAVMGDIDELNSVLGVVITQLSEPQRESCEALFEGIQHQLFRLGSELAVPGHPFIHAEDVSILESWIDYFQQFLSPLKEFILPGGNKASAGCHMARAICRRAERHLLALHQQDQQSSAIRHYLNRLSDLFFVLGRHLNHVALERDVLWQTRHVFPLPPGR